MQSYPFTSRVTYNAYGDPIYDRAVDANFLRNYYKKDRSNGVIALGDSTALQVTENQGMTVKVQRGYCFINGAYGYESNIRTLQIQEADSSDRIDTIVARLNDDEEVRGIDLYVVKGTPAASPTAPSLTRTSTIWELGLANLYIPSNSSSIPQERITDTRLSTERCGYSVPLQELDTEHIFDQFTAWFNTYVSHLDADVAVNLQTEINSLTESLDEINDTIGTFVQTRTLSASGWSNGVYNLASIYPNNEYDIQVTPCTLTTSAQLKAWSLARPIGSASANTITALGTTPSIDITVMVVATKKGAS